jgi:uncharacterized protein (TIRG00374 family)
VIRRFLFWFLLIGFLWLVISRLADARQLALTLARGQWQWVLVAALLQLAYFMFVAASYQSAFDTVEEPSRILELLPLVLGSIFMSVVAPSAGTSGAALFIDDAAQRGRSPGRIASGTILQIIANFVAFTLILITGMAYLFAQHDLQSYEIAGAAVLLLMITGLTSMLLMGLWKTDLLRHMLDRLQRALNGVAQRFHRPHILALDRAARNTDDFIQASSAAARRPDRLLRTVLLAFVANLINLLCLYTLFLAFRQPIQAGPLTAGYAMGILFLIVSIIPQGIGVVEGIMVLVYTSLNVPIETATTISLAFRGLTFWLPFVLGFLSLRRTRTFRRGKGVILEN